MLHNLLVFLAHMMRYMLISCASSFVSTTILILPLLVVILIRGASLTDIFDPTFFLALAVLMTGVFAAMIFGGIMLILQNIFAVCRRRSSWIAAGCIAGCIIGGALMLNIDPDDSSLNERKISEKLLFVMVISFIGGPGAWVFLKLWHFPHIIPPFQKKSVTGRNKS